MKTKTLLLALVAVIAIGIAAYFLTTTPSQTQNYADDASPVMYFYSESCKFCQQQKPILRELAEEGYRVKMMNVDGNPEYWAQYEISGTPTFLAGNGDRQVGLTQKDALRAWLQAHGAKIVSGS
ncbi:MAG TPA: thioredoxin family protein [Candidatus Norongarragalinales archaeon]|nr:thioredoxin family protein [Candidatus Norongarragalinales archaeon]